MPFGEVIATYSPDNTNDWDMDETANEAAVDAAAVDEESAVEASEMQDILDQRNREIGAKILAIAGFQDKHKESTHKSLDQYQARRKEAKSRGEKLRPLAGKGEQRKNDAYIYRIEKIFDATKNETDKARRQKRFFELYSHETLVKPENIPDSYWEKQEQILRDEGHGDIYLDPAEREFRADELINQQKESIKPWAKYLGHENCPYPTWFKIYAMDGVLNLGPFDKKENKFAKRDKTTVAPYPHLSEATLAKVYGAISDFYNLEGQDFNTKTTEREDESPEKSTRDKKVQALIESGNFSTLYAHFLTESKEIISTPEKTEDVKGQWKEYAPGDEEALADAADGTPWCVASPSVGRSYLSTGKYGERTMSKNPNSKAKFILFHLQDENENLSEQASASIRLDIDGKVAEISGLLDGQALEPALVPIVEEKVKTLPGGEKFLTAFADKKTLIALDRKMQAGEDFTDDELAFIFELHRKIVTLDTYNDLDPRIEDLKTYGTPQLAKNIDTFIKRGMDINNIVDSMYLEDAIESIDTLLEHGADIKRIVNQLSSECIVKNLDTLLERGADIDYIAGRMTAASVAKNLDTLLEHGANIDINRTVAAMIPDDVIKYLDTLLEHGADIDINQIVERTHFLYSLKEVDTLLSHNIDIDRIIKSMGGSIAFSNLDELLKRGANIDQIVNRMSPQSVIKNIDTLTERGANIDINKVVNYMQPNGIIRSRSALHRLGVNIDMNQVANHMQPKDLIQNLDTLIELGVDVDIDHAISQMSSLDILKYLDTLLEHDVDIDDIIDGITTNDVIRNLDTLLEHGAEIDSVINTMQPKDLIKNLDTLLEHNADISYIIDGLPRADVIRNLDTLLEHGADVEQIVELLGPTYAAENINTLRKYDTAR